MYDVTMTSKDMARARWPRTVAKARRLAEWLRALDYEVREPDSFDVYPPLRDGRSSAIVDVSPVAVTEDNEAATGPKTGE